MKSRVYAGTGHRPPTLGLSYKQEDRLLLRKFAISQLKRRNDVGLIIS